jgi:hypothetical protein
MSYVSGASRPEHLKVNAQGEEDNAVSKVFCNKTNALSVTNLVAKNLRMCEVCVRV